MTQSDRRPQLSIRRRGYLVAAAVILLCAPIDWLDVGEVSLGTLLIRSSWAVMLAVLGVALPHRGPTYAHWAGLLGSVASVFHFAGIVAVAGGTTATTFNWIIALPLAVVAILQPDVRTAVATAAATILCATGLVVLDGGGASEVTQWFLMSFSASVVAVWGAHSFHRVSRLQLASAEERAEALTRLAHTEKVAARSERMAMVGQLASGVAHEINNPLSFVRSNVSCLESALTVPGEVSAQELREIFADTRCGLERIRQIVSDLRTFARDEDGAVVPCDLHPLVEEALRLGRVKLKAVAELEVSLPQTLPTASVNARHLSQVLLNLLVNAADALEASHVPRPRVTLGARVEEGHVVLTVADNGPGIPAHLRARVFEPFFTTKAPGHGTGLGLSISREYLSRMGGSLQLAEGTSAGACFELRVPIARETAAAGEEVVALDPAANPGPGLAVGA